jgi:1-deoxy-D-xylulose-5-phosphate reductoisomerase
MKKLIILGSTGSLGTQTVEVLQKYKKFFNVIGICANKNCKLLNEQAKFLSINPKNVVLASRDGAAKVTDLAKIKKADIVINLLSGISGISSTKAALKTGKILLLGNKESLVADGFNVMKIAPTSKNHIPQIIPLDSEHNAIYEILKTFPEKKVEEITLPCSGGPLLGMLKKELKHITVKEALSHPKWSMGAKITIESATLINKGFEVIEAHHLFNIPLSRIKVKIHPECEIHGIVKFKGEKEDIAYVSSPDMREHIENALLRVIGKIPKNRLIKLKEKKYILKSPNQKAFLGIKIVLDKFKASPQKMKEFLKKEEKAIDRFLKGSLTVSDFYRLIG